MDVEQVIGGALLIGDLLLGGFTGRLRDFQRVIQLAEFIAQPHAQIGRLDALGDVELKSIAVLVDVVKRGAKPLRHANGGMSDSPNGGTLFSVPKTVVVFEGDLRECPPISTRLRK